ncbi:putative quinol monooxygenase [Vibrio sonorensis]|uniref:putative quinol monooxygenase n=1 Tax=Vibrio sonorensis TaxID=1004316 RepID=UPI0008DA4422|nr:putative quinol monooxygenase [Vibrio sonorensis]
MYTVIVQFNVKATFFEQFKSLLCRNADASIQEPQCLQFDVSWSKQSNDFFLYEIYQNAEAFDHHLTTEHFAQFNADSKNMVLDKQVTCFKNSYQA